VGDLINPADIRFAFEEIVPLAKRLKEKTLPPLKTKNTAAPKLSFDEFMAQSEYVAGEISPVLSSKIRELLSNNKISADTKLRFFNAPKSVLEKIFPEIPDFSEILDISDAKSFNDILREGREKIINILSEPCEMDIGSAYDSENDRIMLQQINTAEGIPSLLHEVTHSIVKDADYLWGETAPIVTEILAGKVMGTNSREILRINEMKDGAEDIAALSADNIMDGYMDNMVRLRYFIGAGAAFDICNEITGPDRLYKFFQFMNNTAVPGAEKMRIMRVTKNSMRRALNRSISINKGHSAADKQI
jgi:hypothetical protein